MFDLPTLAQLRECADDLGMNPTDGYLESTQRVLGRVVETYRALDALPDNVPPVRYPRTPGYRPEAAENPHGAWYIKTAIRGARRGKLAGKRVAVKDTVCVAGVRMIMVHVPSG